MNYLGHAFLSLGDPEILVGNMIGDYVKGKKALDNYPEKIKKGILLHRQLDSMADMHPATTRAKVWFRERYSLYSGPIIDIVYDHFLATDPHFFKNEEYLYEFSQDVYKKLEEHSQYFPPQFAKMFPYMVEQNWLYNYRHVKGVERSLGGLYRRAKSMPPTDDAYNTFILRYYQLEQCFFEFMEKAYNFVNTELMGK